MTGMAIFCLPVTCFPVADTLRYNIGIADITPEDSVLLAGFAARKGLSEGVHRPLKTHCIVFQKDTVRICIISNDMMEIALDFAGQLRREISEKTGIPTHCIFIHNTHTHSAPNTRGDPDKPNARYKQKFAATVVANAVHTAGDQAAFRPFSIEVGRGTCDINCNRREADGPIDHTLYAARLLDKKGRVAVSFINFSCHPVSLNHRSLMVSTDFPGVAREDLEKEWGSPVFYFSGASGNVDPCGALRADTAYTQERGRQLAQAALEIKFQRLPAQNILSVLNREVRLPFAIEKVTAEAVNAHADEIKRQTGVSGTWPNDVEGWRKLILERIANGEVKDYLPFEIAAVNAGGLVLLFSQGEPFNEYQTFARESLPETPILFIAYTNGQNSYLPSSHAYRSQGYLYEKEQMHVYIKAPYPLSESMPQVYEAALKELLENIK